MARRRKGLGSSRAVHIEAGRKAASAAAAAAKRVHELVKDGRCTGALMAYADMQRDVAVAEAHNRARGSGAGGAVWIPHIEVSEAAGVFSDRCVRIKPVEPGSTVDGARRRRRR